MYYFFVIPLLLPPHALGRVQLTQLNSAHRLGLFLVNFVLCVIRWWNTINLACHYLFSLSVTCTCFYFCSINRLLILDSCYVYFKFKFKQTYISFLVSCFLIFNFLYNIEKSRTTNRRESKCQVIENVALRAACKHQRVVTLISLYDDNVSVMKRITFSKKFVSFYSST